MTRPCSIGVAAALALFLSVTSPIVTSGAPADTALQKRNQARVLSTFPAGRPGVVYALAVEPCKRTPCGMRLQLRAASKVLDAVALEWPSPSNHLQLAAVETGWGVGDVLGPPRDARAWTATIEDTGFVTMARPVELAPDHTGILITQRRGVEPVKRRHVVYLVENNHLVAAWTGTEVDGPSWSATNIVPLREGRQQVVYASGSEGGGAQADRLELKSIWWNDRIGRLEEHPAAETVPLKVVSFGAYPAVSAANDARFQGSCLYSYWILEASEFDGLSRSGYFIGAITADAQLAERAVADAAQCQPPVEGSIVPFKLRK